MPQIPPTINRPFVDLESPLRYGRPVKYLVVHTAECGELDGNDDAVSRYLARMSGASIHASLDNNSITPSVPEDRVAWAASNPLVNNYALQAEWVGMSEQGPVEWADPFSTDQLEVGAWLYARWAVEHSIPIVHGTVQDLRDGKPGFYGHVDSTRAFNNPDGHWDPGPHFPWPTFLELVRKYAGQAAAGLSNEPPTQSPQEDDGMVFAYHKIDDDTYWLWPVTQKAYQVSKPAAEEARNGGRVIGGVIVDKPGAYVASIS